MTVDAEAPKMPGRLVRAFELVHLSRLWLPLTLMGLRGIAIVAKFLLALYTARYLGLSDLGIYGLIVGGMTIVPAVVGLGMTDWIIRKVVGVPIAEALPLITTRLAFSTAIHCIAQPILLAIDIGLGEPIPLRLASFAGLILFFENLATEALDMLIARGRVLLSNVLGFLRAGLWPLPVILTGLIYPPARTLEFLLLGWLSALVGVWIILAILLSQRGRWRHVRFDWRLLSAGIKGGFVFYIKDVSNTLSAFIDRFLISIFLGLELTGVYTLFWSVANVIHSLAVFSIVQANIARLVSAGKKEDASAFRSIERELQIETATWALVLAAGVSAVMPFLLPVLDRPLLQINYAVFWIVIVGMLLRIAADSYGFVLFALHRDRTIAALAVVGAIISAGLNLALTPLVGLPGAAWAFVLTSGALFALRLYFSR